MGDKKTDVDTRITVRTLVPISKPYLIISPRSGRGEQSHPCGIRFTWTKSKRMRNEKPAERGTNLAQVISAATPDF